MSLVAIARPLPFTVSTASGDSSAGAGHANLLTPSPREAFVAAAAGTCDLVIDFGPGGAASIDTVFLGFTNAPAGAALSLYRGTDLTNLLWSGTMLHSYRVAPLRHGAIVLVNPTAPARFYRVRVESPAAPLVAGVLAAGLAIRPGRDAGLPGTGVEPGSGRPIADTGRIDRLVGGGFGIQRGATAGGFQWTVPALSDDERERLYALQLDQGGTSPVVVIEDPEQTLGANEGAHWGYLTRFEPWERQAPGETKWALQVQDWA